MSAKATSHKASMSKTISKLHASAMARDRGLERVNIQRDTEEIVTVHFHFKPCPGYLLNVALLLKSGHQLCVILDDAIIGQSGLSHVKKYESLLEQILKNPILFNGSYTQKVSVPMKIEHLLINDYCRQTNRTDDAYVNAIWNVRVGIDEVVKRLTLPVGGEKEPLWTEPRTSLLTPNQDHNIEHLCDMFPDLAKAIRALPY